MSKNLERVVVNEEPESPSVYESSLMYVGILWVLAEHVELFGYSKDVISKLPTS